MNAPTSFGLGLFLRVAIPGFFAVALASPLFRVDIPTANNLALLTGLSTAIGFAAVLLDSFFYQLFEGRIFWPGCWREEKRKRWERWLDARWAEIAKIDAKRATLAEGTDDRRRLDMEVGELYSRLGEFAFSRHDERPHAVWPTRFGNLMASYEDYSETRYGMDASFYWYRIWLLVPEDTRREYDDSWAIGQVWLYLAAISALFVAVYSLLAIWIAVANALSAMPMLSRLFGAVPLPRLSAGLIHLPTAMVSNKFVIIAPVGMAVVSFVLWMFTYRLAILQHVSSGEFFKALFDVYREELEVQPFVPGASGDWSDACYFLTFLKGGSVLGRARKGTSK